MGRLRQLNAIHSISGDKSQIPMIDVDRAIAFYVDTLGFTLRSTHGDPIASAVLTRDDVEIGLSTNGLDPEQISFYIGVNDVDALTEELRAHGAAIVKNPEPMTHDGKQYRVIWLKDPDGVCYCIGQLA